MAFRSYVTRNIGWKVFSLLLAVVIWTVGRSHLTTQLEQIKGSAEGMPSIKLILDARPIKILAQPGQEGRFKTEPPEVKITLLGGAPVAGIDPKEVHAFVDLSDIPPGSGTNRLARKILVQAPAGAATEIKTEPDSVLVERVGHPAAAPKNQP